MKIQLCCREPMHSWSFLREVARFVWAAVALFVAGRDDRRVRGWQRSARSHGLSAPSLAAKSVVLVHAAFAAVDRLILAGLHGAGLG